MVVVLFQQILLKLLVGSHGILADPDDNSVLFLELGILFTIYGKDVKRATFMRT